MALDVASLAAAATAFLVPYVTKTGEKAAERVGEKLPDFAGRVWNAIVDRLRGRPVAEEAAADWVAKPEEEDLRTVFLLQLREALEADPYFAGTLADLLAKAQREAGVTVADVDSGAVAAASVVAGAGGVAVGGNVHGDVVTGSNATVFDPRDPPRGSR